MIQISNTGMKSDSEDVARLQEEFRAVSCVRIPKLLHPSLLAFLQCRLERAQWKSRAYHDLGLEYITDDGPVLHLCHFVTNSPGFRALMERITGAEPFNEFRGRVYRMASGVGHHDNWHDDNFENRLVGMSLNLSPLGYHGGLSQLRKKGSKEKLAQIANTGFGDALVFRISQELEQRVSEVEGNEPKTAFAGWFRPDLPGFFEDVLKYARTEAESSS